MKTSEIVWGKKYRTHLHVGDGWSDVVTAISPAKHGRVVVRGKNGRTGCLRAKDLKP